MAKKKNVVHMSREKAEELYFNINSYYIGLQVVDSVDKMYFDKFKFWNSRMDNHLRRARQSIGELLREFNRELKAVDTDMVDYEAPAELLVAIQELSRLHPDKIREITQNIKNQKA